jgi:hypothetical protein
MWLNRVMSTRSRCASHVRCTCDNDRIGAAQSSDALIATQRTEAKKPRYSIASSARASSVGGTSRSNVLGGLEIKRPCATGRDIAAAKAAKGFDAIPLNCSDDRQGRSSLNRARTPKDSDEYFCSPK